MADISAWSPVDESNTAAPPNGWPENMQCSGVNNSARAMMGAIRRNYDSVTAQFAALPGQFLPLAGGTVSGNLAVGGTVTGQQLTSTGNINAAGLVTASGGYTTPANIQVNGNVSVGGATFAASSGDQTVIYDRSGNANITMYNAAGTNYYDNGQHQFRGRAAGTTFALFNVSGTFNQTGSWATVSDDRLKRNVASYDAGLAELRQLAPVSFEYTEEAGWGGEARRNYGLMASQVAQVLPEMVGEIELDIGPVQTLYPTHLVFVLLNTCKELAAQNDALGARVAALEATQSRRGTNV